MKTPDQETLGYALGCSQLLITKLAQGLQSPAAVMHIHSSRCCSAAFWLTSSTLHFKIWWREKGWGACCVCEVPCLFSIRTRTTILNLAKISQGEKRLPVAPRNLNPADDMTTSTATHLLAWSEWRECGGWQVAVMCCANDCGAAHESQYGYSWAVSQQCRLVPRALLEVW
jgi:hypothetical protein